MLPVSDGLITPRAVRHSPLQPPYPQKSSSPADFTSEISPVPVSPQFLPTVTALVQANLSSGYVNSLLTGLTVSPFLQSVCLTITKVLLSVYDHIFFHAARPSLTFLTRKINANGWSWHVRLFIAWAIHPFSLAPSHSNFMSPRPLSRMLWPLVSGRPDMKLVTYLLSAYVRPRRQLLLNSSKCFHRGIYTLCCQFF